MTQPGNPDAAGANNLFVVEPRGWYAMMSLHAPAMRPKLVDAEPIEVQWRRWVETLTESRTVVSAHCIDGITSWIGTSWMGNPSVEFNQYANAMLESLNVNNGARPMGRVVFTAYDPILGTVGGLGADQFATLAAAYRRAAQRISPRLYGRDVEVVT